MQAESGPAREGAFWARASPLITTIVAAESISGTLILISVMVLLT
jgi:hypothetical protein